MYNKKILISHSKEDKVIVDNFIKLFHSLGITQVLSVFSSFSATSSEVETIYQYLKQKSNRNPYVIFFLSNNYYSSYACLNEMGALWLATKKENRFAILVDDFDFSKLQGAIDPRNICINLAKIDAVTHISKKITAIYSYLNIDNTPLSSELQKKVNAFIQQFASLTEDFHGYFYSKILETHTIDYWPEAQFLKIEKNISHKKLEDSTYNENETHWLVYLDGIDRPISTNEYVKFKITGKSNLCKKTNERRIYLSDISIFNK